VNDSTDEPSPAALSRLSRQVFASVVALVLLVSCQQPIPTPTPFDPSINLDSETQALIASARRAVFLIPFSHWDTDWHDTFDVYARLADKNILAAIQLAKKQPRFRYALEQVLFVQHFWETHPESRADLKALVQNGQIRFAWGGITQPETSLAAPGVQWHNLLQGQAWIADTFGPEFVPTGAWQSDAFGNSAALPVFLSQAGISHLYLGRWRQRCLDGELNCQSLPQTFYWKSPLPSSSNDTADRILVTSVSYTTAWGTLLNQKSPEEQITAYQAMIEEQFNRSSSRYLFLPYGFDFLDPDPALLDLVERWNAANKDTVLVISDPDTAYHYLATQDLPEITVDLNPLWQAFYGTRPYARIADKESEFYLTAIDKFGQFLSPTVAGDWQTAAINAHYDNLSAVGYDQVWAASQQPRFEQAVSQAAEQLTAVLSGIANRVMTDAPESPEILFFNPLSWARGGVVEIRGRPPETAAAQVPEQRLDEQTVAVFINPLPPTGYASLERLGPQVAEVPHPAGVLREGDRTTLSNGLVSVRLDAAWGGTFDRLSLPGEPPVELLSGVGDDLVYVEDTGDVYGARFGAERALQSQVPAQIDVLAGGPLVARAQITFSLGGQPVTKTVTLRADSPLVEVTLQMKALPETSALMRTSTSLQTDTRTDDLGFAAFEHPVDARPIQPGDITYRRNIFYPITYWSDVSSGDYGLSLITHGLQGVGGTGELNLLLVRSVSDPGDQASEGVTDTELHTFRYAYAPHRGDATESQPWREAYAFNQPIIPVWRTGSLLSVQLPFQAEPATIPYQPSEKHLPDTQSLASAEGAVIVDAYQQSGLFNALVVNYEPSKPASLNTPAGTIDLPYGWLSFLTR